MPQHKIIGWVPKVKNAPKVSAPTPSSQPTPKPDGWEMDKVRWREEVEQAKMNKPAWDREPEKGPGLLENITPDPVKDRDDYIAVVSERLLRR